MEVVGCFFIPTFEFFLLFWLLSSPRFSMSFASFHSSNWVPASMEGQQPEQQGKGRKRLRDRRCISLPSSPMHTPPASPPHLTHSTTSRNRNSGGAGSPAQKKRKLALLERPKSPNIMGGGSSRSRSPSPQPRIWNRSSSPSPSSPSPVRNVMVTPKASRVRVRRGLEEHRLQSERLRLEQQRQQTLARPVGVPFWHPRPELPVEMKDRFPFTVDTRIMWLSPCPKRSYSHLAYLDIGSCPE